jgi:acyl-coenzyme A thioesterase PaaI-like protein
MGAGVLDIHGRALRVGGRIAFAEAHARNGDGDLVGHATTSTLLRPRAGDIHNGRQRR